MSKNQKLKPGILNACLFHLTILPFQTDVTIFKCPCYVISCIGISPKGSSFFPPCCVFVMWSWLRFLFSANTLTFLIADRLVISLLLLNWVLCPASSVAFSFEIFSVVVIWFPVSQCWSVLVCSLCTVILNKFSMFFFQQVFCASCCSLKCKLLYMDRKEARVCVICHSVLMNGKY